jgi:hypothetical protein
MEQEIRDYSTVLPSDIWVEIFIRVGTTSDIPAIARVIMIKCASVH